MTRRFLALLNAAVGRWEEATSIAEPDSVVRRQIWTVAVLAPFLPTTVEQVEALRRITDGDARPAEEDVMAAVSRAYLLGLLDLRLGDDTATVAAAGRIDSLAAHVAPRDTASARLLARSLRATVAVDRGDVEGALTALGHVDGPMPYLDAYDPVIGRLRERYLLGVLLLETGRLEEARRWLDHGIVGSDRAAILYRPISQLRLAEVHDRLGNAEEARRHYTNFIRNFDRADPALQPLVERARSALRRLAGERE